jgi:hypothetical protein
LRTAGEKIAE